jgi:hypothetical protein
MTAAAQQLARTHCLHCSTLPLVDALPADHTMNNFFFQSTSGLLAQAPVPLPTSAQTNSSSYQLLQQHCTYPANSISTLNHA